MLLTVSCKHRQGLHWCPRVLLPSKEMKISGILVHTWGHVGVQGPLGPCLSKWPVLPTGAIVSSGPGLLPGACLGSWPCRKQSVHILMSCLFVCFTQKNNLRLGLTFLTMPMNGQLPVEHLGKYVKLTTYSPNLDFTRNLFKERKVQYEAVDWHTWSCLPPNVDHNSWKRRCLPPTHEPCVPGGNYK